MNIKITEVNGQKIALVHEDTILLKDEQSALDFIMTTSYETGSNRLTLNKEAISEFLILVQNLRVISFKSS